jgi:hypothetical protein
MERLRFLKTQYFRERSGKEFSVWAIYRADNMEQKFPEDVVLQDLARQTFPEGKRELSVTGRHPLCIYCAMQLGVSKQDRLRFLLAIEKTFRG